MTKFLDDRLGEIFQTPKPKIKMDKEQIIKEIRKAKKELDIVFETNLIPKRDQAINNCYFILMDIIRNK